MGEDPTGQPSRARVSVQEAAEHLGTTVDAIRKRVQRDTIAHEKDADGRVWILLDIDRTRHATDQDAAGQRQDGESGPLISEMRGRIEDLREQLDAERQAHAEARRLLMAALERIPPQLEAPSSGADSAPVAPGSPERGEADTAGGVEADPQAATSRPPWWRRWFRG